MAAARAGMKYGYVMSKFLQFAGIWHAPDAIGACKCYNSEGGENIPAKAGLFLAWQKKFLQRE
jgi:hypothetical protein